MVKNSLNRRIYTLNCNGRLVHIDSPAVMGIINVTPDSFYTASRQQNLSNVIRQAEKMIAEGALFIDIGGQSTRPGNVQIDVETELTRVIPAIESVLRSLPGTLISIDTFYSRVAQQAVAAGAAIVNDVSAGTIDSQMLPIVAGLHVPYICMHAKGAPETMHINPTYQDVAKEVLDFFIQKVDDCRNAGIRDIIIDPGFGFGKTIAHNFELLKKLPIFQMLDAPVLVGMSRKSTIYKTLKITAEEALNGTTVLNTLALINGASILRVHDVKEAREAVLLLNEIY